MRKKYLIPFTPKKFDITQQAQKYLNDCYQIITDLVKQDESSAEIHCLRADMIDELIKGILAFYSDDKSLNHNHFALVAIGGYGRKEMSLLSDVDILFIVQPEYADVYQKLSKKVLYVLWDLKFEVGHAVRSVDETVEYMKADQTVFTALLDARFIYGDEFLFKILEKNKRKLLDTFEWQEKLFWAKYHEREKRLKKYGDTVYLLEPHIKEGEGGLRDLQMLHWLGKVIGVKNGFNGFYDAGFIDMPTLQELNQAKNYLLRLRNRLHIYLCRKSDQLTFDAQMTLANELGFFDDTKALGVEKFMQAYYAIATQVNRNAKVLIAKIAAHLNVDLTKNISPVEDYVLCDYFCVSEAQIKSREENVFLTDTTNLMSVFLYVQKTGLDIHFFTRDQMVAALDNVDDDFIKDSRVQAAFKTLMGHYENLGLALFVMHEIGFLEAYIPEFKRVKNRMQHDLYHVYTVDTHSLFAVNELSKLATDQAYQKAYPIYFKALSEIKNKDLLSLAVLFHDIGKSKEGDHALIGAFMADVILERMGYEEKERQTVEFLIKSHLIMSHLSQRRDLQDLHMVREFARAVKTKDNLNMLLVLTFADIRAVNKEAWTNWKDTLLQNLYQQTCFVLSEEQASEACVQKKVADVRQAITRRLKKKTDTKQIEAYLQSISPRYVLAHSDNEIEEHFRLIKDHDDSNILFVEKEISKAVMSEVLIYTLSNPRVIPLITGVFLALGINIMTMENFMIKDGHVLVKMRVQSVGGHSLSGAEQISLIKKYLSDVFLGKKQVKELIKKRKRALFMQKKPVQKADTQILIDNDVSAYYTVIDVLTHDRLGLIYDIVSCLSALGCYVELSKISTKIDQVVDTLYVKDIFGHKITSQDKINEIKQSLLHAIKI